MNRHRNVIGALLRKDFLSLWPLVLLVVALRLAQVLDAEFDITFLSAQAKQFLPFAYVPAYGFFLLISIHQDALASVRHDVLTRPIPSWNLVTAKGMFIWGAMFLPVVLGTFVACLVNGGSFVEALLVAITIENPMLIALVLLVIVLAVVTSTLLEAVGAFVGIFIVILLMERFVTRLSSTGEAVYFLGSGWVILKPWGLLALISVAIVVWLQYGRRNTMRARMTLAVLALLLMVFPAPFTWHRVIAIQKAVTANSTAADALKISLTSRCFPTALFPPPGSLVGGIDDDSYPRDTGESTANQLKVYPTTFGSERHNAAGRNAIAFSTAIVPTGAPLDWKVLVSNVQATYRNDSDEVLHTLWYARVTPIWKPAADGARSAVHLWLLPRDSYERLVAASAHLQVDYSFGLLEPHSFELPVDGKRHYLAALGYCGAKRDPLTSSVTVKCFKSGDQPGLVAAKYIDVQMPEVVASEPDFTPAWLSYPGGKRYKIKLPATAVSDSSRIKITAYEARAHTERKLVVPGVLGGTPTECPAPIAQ